MFGWTLGVACGSGIFNGVTPALFLKRFPVKIYI